MLNIIRVDQTTRIILPDSQWAKDVQAKLVELGHNVEVVGTLSGDSHAVMRDEAELGRMHALLESTGL